MHSALTQKGLKEVFDVALQTVVAPAESQRGEREEERRCVVL